MTKLTKLGARRLLKLATILDTADAKHRKRGEPRYRQARFGHEEHPESGTPLCGTPACALGHYAASARRPGWGWDKKLGMRWPGLTHAQHKAGDWTWGVYPFDAALIEFDIDKDAADELFDSHGMGGAKTAKQAAKYIRSFVARKGVA